MKAVRCILLLACVASGAARCVGADTQWVLEKSTLAYHVSHPLHQIDGVSHAAKGKGVCHDGQCEFLIAVPVKSFDSGDSNRDLHMLQVVRGAQYPLVTVRVKLPESAAAQHSLDADAQIDFAGHTQHYTVRLELATQGGEAHIAGAIPATMSAFGIDPPSLLAIRCKDEMPVRVDMTWRRQ